MNSKLIKRYAYSFDLEVNENAFELMSDEFFEEIGLAKLSTLRKLQKRIAEFEGYDGIAADTIALQKALKVANQKIEELTKTLKEQTAASKPLMLSPTEICSRYRVQNCDCCNSITCCDNTSPLKKALTAEQNRAGNFRKAVSQQPLP